MTTDGATILLADDDAMVRNALRRLLEDEGFRVTTTNDGSEALEAMGRVRPDVVVLDVLMPKLDGFQVCCAIKARKATRLTPVILVTGLGDTDDRVRGIDAGADDFLSKPVKASELIARVHSAAKQKRYTDEMEHTETVLVALAKSIEGKDPYTDGHCERLSHYATALGTRLGLHEDFVTALRRAGAVHDIGKVAIPDAVLQKRGPLTADEWHLMRQHPEIGERICGGLHSFRLVTPVVRHHHERGDGSGYPDGLKGNQIPITARVLQVVDVYDAITTERPYKAAQSHDEALRILHEESDAGWWDRDVVTEFAALLSDEPERRWATCAPSRELATA